MTISLEEALKQSNEGATTAREKVKGGYKVLYKWVPLVVVGLFILSSLTTWYEEHTQAKSSQAGSQTSNREAAPRAARQQEPGVTEKVLNVSNTEWTEVSTWTYTCIQWRTEPRDETLRVEIRGTNETEWIPFLEWRKKRESGEIRYNPGTYRFRTALTESRVRYTLYRGSSCE
jgi:hypothetical protein